MPGLILLARLADIAQSRLGFSSPKRFSPSRLLSRRTTGEQGRPKTSSSPLPTTNPRVASTPPPTEQYPPEPHSSGDKRTRPLWLRSQTQQSSPGRGNTLDNNEDLPEPKRRRVPDPIEISSGQNENTKAGYQEPLSFSRNNYAMPPATKQVDIPTRPSLQNGTENSSDSVVDTSSVWDELDDLKSRIRNLEITTVKPRGAPASTVNGTRESRRRSSANPSEQGPLISSARHKRATSPGNTYTYSPRVSHQLLRAALAKAERQVPSTAYAPLEIAVAGALDLSAALFASQQDQTRDVDMSDAISTVTGTNGTSDKRLNRKAENLCRNLTDLCIALCDLPLQNQTQATERASSRLTTYERSASRQSTYERSASRLTRGQTTPSSYAYKEANQFPFNTLPDDSSPLTHLEERRAAAGLSRPSSQLRRARTDDTSASSPSGRLGSFLNGVRKSSVANESPERDPTTPRASRQRSNTAVNNDENASVTGTPVYAPRSVSSANAYRGLGDSLVINGPYTNQSQYNIPPKDSSDEMDMDCKPTNNNQNQTTTTRPSHSRSYTTASAASANAAARLNLPNGNPQHAAPPKRDESPYHEFSRAYTARHPMPELSPKYSNRDLRNTTQGSISTGTDTAAADGPRPFEPNRPPPPPPIFSSPSALAQSSPIPSQPPVNDSPSINSTTTINSITTTASSTTTTRTPGATPPTIPPQTGASNPNQRRQSKSYTPSPASLLAERILGRRGILGSNSGGTSGSTRGGSVTGSVGGFGGSVLGR